MDHSTNRWVDSEPPMVFSEPIGQLQHERRQRQRILADAQSALDHLDVTMQHLLLTRDALMRAID